MKKVLLLISLVISLFGGAMEGIPDSELRYTYDSTDRECLNVRTSNDAAAVTEELRYSQQAKLVSRMSAVVTFDYSLGDKNYRFYYFRDLESCNRFIAYLNSINY